MAGYYGIILVVRVSLRLSYVHRPYFRFRTITCVNVNGFSPNLVCVLILWRPGLGLLKGKFRQFLTALSAYDTFVFQFLDDNFSKYQYTFTKPGLCIDIMESWLWIAKRQISSIFDNSSIHCLTENLEYSITQIRQLG